MVSECLLLLFSCSVCLCGLAFFNFFYCCCCWLLFCLFVCLFVCFVVGGDGFCCRFRGMGRLFLVVLLLLSLWVFFVCLLLFVLLLLDYC